MGKLCCYCGWWENCVNRRHLFQALLAYPTGGEKYGKAIKYDSKPSFPIPPPPFLLWHKALFPAISPTFLPRKKGGGEKREKILAGKVTMCCRLLGEEGGRDGDYLGRHPSFWGFPLFLLHSFYSVKFKTKPGRNLWESGRKSLLFLLRGSLETDFEPIIGKRPFL